MKELEKRLFNDRAIALLARKLNEYQVRLNEGKTSELVAQEKQQNEIRGQMANIVNAVAAGFSQTAFAEKLKELEDALAQTENKIIAIRSRATVPTITEETVRQILSTFREYVRQRNIPEIKKFISSYVERVIVYKDRVEAVFVVREAKLVGNTPYTFRLMANRKTLPRRRRRAA
jgi:site-specific DNA recombinase